MRPQSFHNRLAAAWTGALASKVCVFLAFTHIARTLAPAGYGQVEWALSVTVVFTLIADAGLSTWASAHIGARPEDAAPLIPRVGWARLMLAAPAYVLLGATAWLRGGDAGEALAIDGLILFLAPLSVQYVFDGLFGTQWSAFGSALRGVAFLAAVLALVHPHSRPPAVAVAEVIAVCALTLYQVIVLTRVVRLRVRVFGERRYLRALLAGSWPIGASSVAWSLHMYTGLILLGALSMSDSAAWFSASLRVLIAIHTGVWLYHSTLLPTMARLAVEHSAEWPRVVDQSLSLTGWAGNAFAVVGTLAAAPLLAFAFGPAFAASAPSFVVLVWVVPIAWMGEHLHYALIAAGHPSVEYRARLIGTLTAIALTCVLVPLLRGVGAAIAVLMGSIVSVVAARVLARPILPPVAYERSVAPSVAGGALALALGLLLRPVVGALPSAAGAGALLFLMAVLAERDHARDLLRLVLRTSSASQADASS